MIFNFIIGNGDAHFKNYSICYKDKTDCYLSPAYDIVCSKLVIPEEEDSALTINGKKNKLTRNDFDKWADDLKIPKTIRYKKFDQKFHLMQQLIKNSFLPKKSQEKFIEIIQTRLSRLNLSE